MKILKSYLQKIDRNLLLMLYKIAYDVLFLSLITFFFSIIAEGILPGFISEHMGFTKIILLLLILIVATIALGKYLHIQALLKPARKNILSPLFLLISFLLIGNTMLKLPLWQNLLFTITMVIIMYQFFALSLEDEK